MLKISTVEELEDYATMRERGWDVDKAAKVVRFREDLKVDLEVCFRSLSSPFLPSSVPLPLLSQVWRSCCPSWRWRSELGSPLG
jgi:hypothetical protein